MNRLEIELQSGSNCPKQIQRSALILLCNVLVMFSAGAAISQENASANTHSPELGSLHQDIDWDYYCDPSHKAQYLDNLKCIPLGADRLDNHLSIGGEIRQRGEYFDYPQWGQDPPDNGYSLERYMIYGDLKSTRSVRFFTEFESGLEFGRDGGPRPVIDKDELFLHQAFVDLTLHQGAKQHVVLRAGRQELSFGSSRLVGIRDGPNVRQNFDGFRLTWSPAAWTIDGLATKFSENNPGVFDDPPNHAYTFWGVYATHALNRVPHTSIDFYYLGIDRKKATFEAGTGREQRETFGTRVAGKTGPIDHDTEVIAQFGTFANRDIRAWAVSTNAGYTFALASDQFRTRIAFDGGIASGNHNPHSGNFGTFNALFPKGAYFSEAELIGPYNVQVARPSVKFILPKHDLTIWPNAEFLWRQSRQDGVYAVPGILVRPSGTSTALYVGGQADLTLDWHPTRHLFYTLDYLHFFPGAFLKQTMPAKGVNFMAVWATYRF